MNQDIEHYSAKPQTGRCKRCNQELPSEHFVKDLEGQEFPDVESARQEAIASAREILAERIRAGATANGDEVDVCDASGEVLATVPLLSVLKRS